MECMHRRISPVILLITFAITAHSGELNNPPGGTATWKEYSTGEKLDAETLNNHFDDIARAVNDNNARAAVKSANSEQVAQITSTTGQEVLNIEVTPSASGFVVVYASGTLGIAQTSAGKVELHVSLDTTTGTVDSAHSTTLHRTTTVAESTWVPLNVVGVFPVENGVSSFFFLNARINDGATIANFYVGNISNDTKLTAVFIPLSLN